MSDKLTKLLKEFHAIKNKASVTALTSAPLARPLPSTAGNSLFANKSDLEAANARIKKLEAENAALKSRPLAITPKNQTKASPTIPLMPNGKVDTLAITRAQMAQEQADKKAASDAVSAKRPAGKIILNPSKYRTH